MIVEGKNIERVGQAVVFHVKVIALVAAVVGAASGWIGALALETVDEAARVSAFFHLALFLILPIALATSFRFQAQRGGNADWSDDVLVLIGGFSGILGALVGNLLFFLIAAYIPFVFGGMDWPAMRAALLAHIGWTQMVLLIVASSIVAVPLARMSMPMDKREL